MTSRRNAIVGIAMAVGTVVLALAAAEVVLRAVGSRYELLPRTAVCFVDQER